MITSKLTHWRSIPGLATHPVWSAAFLWIEQHAASAAEGWHEIGTGHAKVRVMSYPTIKREEGIYEAHREMIDIQYTIEGAEAIEFTAAESLVPQGAYDSEKDVQFFDIPKVSEGRVDNLPGRFCILYPEDAHLPQLNVDGIGHVKKLVVKVPRTSIAPMVNKANVHRGGRGITDF
jgi:YhcH/YjgK/YiaL family protein